MPTQQASINKEDEVEHDSDKECNTEGDSVSPSDNDDNNEKSSWRTFCPALYHDTIINMMEKHYCAHPLIPGYGRPHAAGIKQWAVQSMYNFCVKHKLPEVWVYLWENWYCKSRWELWACSGHEMIPILKTTYPKKIGNL